MNEFVVEHPGEDNAYVRQAGTTDVGSSIETPAVKMLRLNAEQSLYFFCRTILGFDRLTDHLHLEVCNFVQKCPPNRKLILLPRDCFKTTIVSKGLPIHIFIQSEEANIYIPGRLGSHLKILLACETEANGQKHVQWMERQLEGNALLRALWPHMVWEKAKAQARAWNSTEFFLPRTLAADQSDPTMKTIGVGGAITGAHVDVIINDDLATRNAMNSPAIMADAIECQQLSRSLLEDQTNSLEFTVGTHWAVSDIYASMRKIDPTIQVYKRSLVEKGKIIFPEEFTWDDIADLKAVQGEPMFALLYQNDPTDVALCDFDVNMIRWFTFEGERLVFVEDKRDREYEEMMLQPRPRAEEPPRDEIMPAGSFPGEVAGRDSWIEERYGDQSMPRRDGF